MNEKAERALVYIAETIGMLGPDAPALPEYNNVLDVINRLQTDNKQLRERVNAVVAWAESCDESANNPDVDADVAYDRKESVRDIYRLLGIESEAPE